MTHRILLVEDTPLKEKQLAAFFEAEGFAGQFKIAHSYKSALKSLLANPPEVLVLDMSLPTFDISGSEGGGTPRPLGGLELLEQLSLRKLTVPTIVVTQWEVFGDGGLKLADLKRRLATDYPNMFQAVVRLSPGVLGWQHDLRIALRDSMSRGDAT